jgi:hypothetical protein
MVDAELRSRGSINYDELLMTGGLPSVPRGVDGTGGSLGSLGSLDSKGFINSFAMASGGSSAMGPPRSLSPSTDQHHHAAAAFQVRERGDSLGFSSASFSIGSGDSIPTGAGMFHGGGGGGGGPRVSHPQAYDSPPLGLAVAPHSSLPPWALQAGPADSRPAPPPPPPPQQHAQYRTSRLTGVQLARPPSIGDSLFDMDGGECNTAVLSQREKGWGGVD